jgi:hypothetical protein
MSDLRVRRGTVLVAGGAAATSLAMGGALGRLVGDSEAVAGFMRFGFTPYEALRTVTALPAEVMGVEASPRLGRTGRGRPR